MKNKILHKIAAALLACLLLGGCFAVCAEERIGGACGETLEWTFDPASGTLTITGSGAMKDFASGYDVPWSEYNARILSVVLPDGLTSVGAYAFYACRLGNKITLPTTLKAIGDEAFAWSGLREIKIPASVVSVGEGAFAGASSLCSITVDSANSVFLAYANCLLRRTGETYELIAGCRTSEIPDAVITEIAPSAFRGVPIENVTLPSTLERIGENAFRASSVRAIVIPASVTAIGANAFSGCASLESLTVEASSPAFRSEANCVIGRGENDGVLLFGCAASVLPDGITEIADNAFADCAGLASAKIPEGVSAIGARAFYNCTGLCEVTLPESLREMGEYAFAWCEKLEKITIPAALTTLERGAFLYCEGLTTLTITETLTAVDDLAFFGCAALARIENYGTEESFAAIAVGERNEPFRNAQMMLCEAVTVLWGDADGDGKIGTKDLARLRKYLSEYDYDTGLSGITVEAGADANGDGAVNSRDLALLRRYLANYDYETGTSTIVLGPSA